MLVAERMVSQVDSCVVRVPCCPVYPTNYAPAGIQNKDELPEVVDATAAESGSGYREEAERVDFREGGNAHSLL